MSLSSARLSRLVGSERPEIPESIRNIHGCDHVFSNVRNDRVCHAVGVGNLEFLMATAKSDTGFSLKTQNPAGEMCLITLQPIGQYYLHNTCAAVGGRDETGRANEFWHQCVHGADGGCELYLELQAVLVKNVVWPSA